MKVFLIASFLSLVGSCATEKYSTKIQNLKDNIKISDTTTIRSYANTITSTELKNLLYTYASKEFEGRGTGEEGQKKAANFLKTYYLSQNISFANKRFGILSRPSQRRILPDDIKATENVVGLHRGHAKSPKKSVVISAHYDHLGIEDDQIY